MSELICVYVSSFTNNEGKESEARRAARASPTQIGGRAGRGKNRPRIDMKFQPMKPDRTKHKTPPSVVGINALLNYRPLRLPATACRRNCDRAVAVHFNGDYNQWLRLTLTFGVELLRPVIQCWGIPSMDTS